MAKRLYLRWALWATLLLGIALLAPPGAAGPRQERPMPPPQAGLVGATATGAARSLSSFDPASQFRLIEPETAWPLRRKPILEEEEEEESEYSAEDEAVSSHLTPLSLGQPLADAARSPSSSPPRRLRC